MKWYTALSSHSSEDYIKMLNVAVYSCLKNTPFKPHIICDERNIYTSQLKDKYKDNITVVYHKGKIFESFCDQFKNDKSLVNQLGTAGAYLRAEIPMVEEDDKYVLYTDTDVLFFNPRNGPQNIPAPKYFAAAPEFEATNWSYFNSGSMIINVDNMREKYNEFHDFVVPRFRELINHAHDQAAYNHLFLDKWDRLPVEYNWKPGWGINKSAVVVHFHGPKPTDIEAYFNSSLDEVNIDVPVDGLSLYKQMIERNTESNRYYLDQYNEYT
jgi:lipopolysaccharide biosynthesis glycosyltransferase